MENWIPLTQRHHLSPQTQTIKGVDVTVYVSPHNVPKAVKGTSLPDGVFRIEFRYLDESEPLFAAPRVSKDRRLSVYLGRHSGRIERIDVAETNPNTHEISLQISVVDEVGRGLRELRDRETTLSTRMNFDAASVAINETMALMHG